VAARIAAEEEPDRAGLASWQPAGSGAAGTAHRNHLAASEHPGAAIDTPYPVAVVGTHVAARNHLDQTGDDRRVGTTQCLDRNLGRARAGLGARGEDRGAQDDDDRRN